MNRTRPKNVTFRCSEEEYVTIKNKALEAKKNIQNYLLDAALDEANNESRTCEIVFTIAAKGWEELQELNAELGRSGNNLNQIARIFNSGGVVANKVLNCVLEEHEKVEEELCRFLRRLRREQKRNQKQILEKSLPM